MSVTSNQTMNQIIPDIYAGLKVASREFIGLMKATNMNTGVEKAAKGESILIPVGKAGDVQDTTVGFDAPKAGGSDGWTQSMQITESKMVTIDWNGELEAGVKNSGQYQNVLTQQFADAFRKLGNMIEESVRKEAFAGAGAAYGTIGKVPFGTINNMGDMAQMRALLNESGTPIAPRTLVLTPEAESSLLTNQMQMVKVNENGSDETMRNGIILPTYGFKVRSSFALTGEHTAGTGTSYVLSGENGAKKGDKEMSIGTGSGSINEGDIITFAADTKHKYVAAAGCTSSLLKLNSPLKMDIPTGNAVTVGKAYKASVAMHDNAIALAIRPPKSPSAGDAAIGVTYVTDAVTGITFEIRMYPGQRAIQFQVAVAWGCKAINNDHIALLLE